MFAVIFEGQEGNSELLETHLSLCIEHWDINIYIFSASNPCEFLNCKTGLCFDFLIACHPTCTVVPNRSLAKFVEQSVG